MFCWNIDSRYRIKWYTYDQPDRRLGHPNESGQKYNFDDGTDHGKYSVAQYRTEYESQKNTDGEEKLKHRTQSASSRCFGYFRNVSRYQNARGSNSDASDEPCYVEYPNVSGKYDH